MRNKKYICIDGDTVTFHNNLEVRKIWIHEGYEHFSLNGVEHKVHRYVWEKVNGKIPKGYHIHHIDHNKLNNNLDNLELMKASDHMIYHHREKIGILNNKHNYKGGYVNFVKSRNKWRAMCCQKYIGIFDTKLEAYQALFKHDPEFWTQEKQDEILNNI